MSFSPLTSFCDNVSFITNAAFFLSLSEFPESSRSRDDLYLDACLVLNSIRDNGEIDDVFFDYLCMHLDYAFRNGGL